jgi:hypothetical protein
VDPRREGPLGDTVSLMNTLLWILAIVAVLTPIVVVAFLLAPRL